MVNDPIAELLAGTWPDPDGGPPLGVPLDRIEIGESLQGREAALLDELRFGPRLLVVSDPDTHGALGARVEAALARRGPLRCARLPRHPHADQQLVEGLRPACRAANAVVAVGSGTVNDLCKRAAFLESRPYAVFATAPSMNGYTSVNAAITIAGHKRTLGAAAPRGVFFDLQVLAAAPRRMIGAGLGDSLCRPSAQADWLLSHLLLGTPYRRAPFALLRGHEAPLLRDAGALLRGDLAAMEHLVRNLVLSGCGMTLCGGSFPASQGEHLVSHYAEMLPPPDAPETLHGEQIGVCTLALARLQRRVLQADPPRLLGAEPDQPALRSIFGRELGDSCWELFRKKRLNAEARVTLQARLQRDWEQLRERLDAEAVDVTQLEDALELAGCPTKPEQLGWSRSYFAQALRHARLIRDRFTFLDLAALSGALEREARGYEG